MKIIIEGNPKEIAALVLAVQERQEKDLDLIIKHVSDSLCTAVDATNSRTNSYL